jgi:carbon monoxide dehydrogenase subunit G
VTMNTWDKTIRTARAAAAAAVLTLSASPLSAGDLPVAPPVGHAPRISVTSSEGTYCVKGSFHVDAPLGVAWDVLTDYDNLATFVSSMRSSTSSRGASGQLMVIQEAVGRVGPFKRAMNVVLDVTEEKPARIAFHDVSGGSFHSYEGAWTLDPAGGGVLVTYVLEARPRSTPRLFGRSIVTSNARDLLEEVRAEMVRRGRMSGTN